MESYIVQSRIITTYHKYSSNICYILNIRMKVKPGSKLRNLIPTSIGAFNESGLVLFSGSGPAVTKVVSIAEIVKRR
jgi:hypothetical protein